jgi:hypothetical protein
MPTLLNNPSNQLVVSWPGGIGNPSNMLIPTSGGRRRYLKGKTRSQKRRAKTRRQKRKSSGTRRH